MGRWLMVAVLGLAGCQVVGPVQRFNQPPPRVDYRCPTAEEQQRRAQARLSYPNNFEQGLPPLDYRTRQPDPP